MVLSERTVAISSHAMPGQHNPQLSQERHARATSTAWPVGVFAGAL